MKILIAEDDDHTREALREVLTEEGFTVVAATDGAAAIDLFRRENPGFVCLDVMMPVMNGYDVCRHIRGLSKTVPVLFLTAKAQEIDKVLGLELGADDYMTKPFGVKEIVARIRAILRRSAPHREASPTEAFEMGGLRVMPGECRAFRDGIEITLTPRDIKLLRMLFDHKGRVLTRREIASEVWGLEKFQESRALDQAVSLLRRRIEADPSNPRIIRTVHGAGYRFDG